MSTMTPEPRLTEVRLTLIATRTVLAPLSVTEPGGGLRVVGDRVLYAERFDAALADPGDRAQPPWEHTGGRSFWSYHLRGDDKLGLPPVSGDDAWRYLIPLRTRLPGTMTAAWPGGAVSAAGYVWPFGVTLLTTFYIRGRMNLAEMVAARAARQDGTLRVEWAAGGVLEGSYPEIEGACLDALTREAFGPGVPTSGERETFSILTAIRGEGGWPEGPALAGGPVHQALHAVTTWRRTWAHDELGSLGEATVRLEKAPPSSLLGRGPRGRLAWLPVAFSNRDEFPHTCACYHRNLVNASAQVEALIALAAATQRLRTTGGTPSIEHGNLARLAAGLLGRAHGGSSGYRSRSLRAQIEDSGATHAIDAMRDAAGMGPLH